MHRRSTITRIATLSALAAAALLAQTVAALPAPAQPAKQAVSPQEKALEIIARHIEAVGGEDVIRAHTDITSTGRISIPSAGLQGTLETRVKAPNQSVLRFEITGYGVSMQGFDGQTAWSIDPSLGAMVLEGEQRDAVVRSSRYDADLRLEKDYDSIAYAGEKEVEGEAVHAVVLTDPHGRETTQYYSKETGLRIGSESIEPSPLGDIAVRYVLSDYREFDGLMIATKTVQYVGPQSVEFVIEDVSFDRVPDSEFDLPPAIRVLVDREDNAGASDDEEDEASDDGDDDDDEDEGDDDDDDGEDEDD